MVWDIPSMAGRQLHPFYKRQMGWNDNTDGITVLISIVLSLKTKNNNRETELSTNGKSMQRSCRRDTGVFVCDSVTALRIQSFPRRNFSRKGYWPVRWNILTIRIMNIWLSSATMDCLHCFSIRDFWPAALYRVFAGKDMNWLSRSLYLQYRVSSRSVYAWCLQYSGQF